MMEEKSFQLMKQGANFEIEPCTIVYDFEDKTRFRRLDTDDAQRMQVTALLQQLPAAAATTALSGTYRASFPEGLPHTLTKLKQGGYGSMIRGEKGFVGSASFYEMTAEAAVLGAFTTMAVVSGQYFLTQINNELKAINQKFDKILEFLYGEKRAELIAEINFIKQAYSNFSSIMAHDYQRTATIISIQEAQKVAMKDIEFYLYDLSQIVAEDAKTMDDFKLIADKALQTQKCLEMSMQLYVMSNLLEIYYAQNYDQPYLASVKDASAHYIQRCEKRILHSFSALNGRITECKPNLLAGVVKLGKQAEKSRHEKRIEAVISSLNDGEQSELLMTLQSAFDAVTQKTELYILESGEVYCKVS